MLRALLFSPLLTLALAGAAHPRPMDLGDPRPRWVSVEFEVSPPERPDQLDSVYTRKLPAWLEPGDATGQIRVSIGRSVVESQLLARENPRPDSFGDFVWIFDAATGHVVSAVLSGTLVRTLGWGIFRKQIATTIRVEMGTRRAGGFREPKWLFGQAIFHYCDRAEGPGCTLVEAVRYDPERGYVNAVGELVVDFRGVTIRTFSPLGEALFKELTVGQPGVSASSPPSSG